MMFYLIVKKLRFDVLCICVEKVGAPMRQQAAANKVIQKTQLNMIIGLPGAVQATKTWGTFLI